MTSERGSAGVAHPGGHAVDGQQHRPLQFGVDLVIPASPDPVEQVDLQVGDRVRGRAPGRSRVRLSSGWSSSRSVSPVTAQHLGDGQLVLGPDHARTGAAGRSGTSDRTYSAAISMSVLASVISTLEMKVRKKCHSPCISAQHVVAAGLPGGPQARTRRRTSRARSAGTGSSRTPTGWRAARRCRRRSRAAGPAGSRCSASRAARPAWRPGSRRAGRGRRSSRSTRRTRRR